MDFDSCFIFAVRAYYSLQMASLKKGHSLVGRSPYPIIKAIKEFDGRLPEELARIKKDHPLDLYSEDQLTDELSGIMGIPTAHIFEMAVTGVTKQNSGNQSISHVTGNAQRALYMDAMHMLPIC